MWEVNIFCCRRKKISFGGKDLLFREKNIFRRKRFTFRRKNDFSNFFFIFWRFNINCLEGNKYLPVGGIYGTLQLDPGHQHGSNRILMFQAVQRVNILENGYILLNFYIGFQLSGFILKNWFSIDPLILYQTVFIK